MIQQNKKKKQTNKHTQSLLNTRAPSLLLWQWSVPFGSCWWNCCFVSRCSSMFLGSWTSVVRPRRKLVRCWEAGSLALWTQLTLHSPYDIGSILRWPLPRQHPPAHPQKKMTTKHQHLQTCCYHSCPMVWGSWHWGPLSGQCCFGQYLQMRCNKGDKFEALLIQYLHVIAFCSIHECVRTQHKQACCCLLFTNLQFPRQHLLPGRLQLGSHCYGYWSLQGHRTRERSLTSLPITTLYVLLYTHCIVPYSHVEHSVVSDITMAVGVYSCCIYRYMYTMGWAVCGSNEWVAMEVYCVPVHSWSMHQLHLGFQCLLEQEVICSFS